MYTPIDEEFKEKKCQEEHGTISKLETVSP